jgi:hypothetical protein
MLTNLIQTSLTNNQFVTVDTFRDMFINGLPGKLSFLAFSRTGDRVLPIFEPSYSFVDEMVDYNTIKNILGEEWTPVIGAHVLHQIPGQVPNTLLTVGGLVDEKMINRIFGVHPHYHYNVGMVLGLNFGYYKVDTLPKLAMYTIDLEGSRRLQTVNSSDEGWVRDSYVDHYGHIRYIDWSKGTTYFSRFLTGTSTLEWHIWPLVD